MRTKETGAAAPGRIATPLSQCSSVETPTRRGRPQATPRRLLSSCDGGLRCERRRRERERCTNAPPLVLLPSAATSVSERACSRLHCSSAPLAASNSLPASAEGRTAGINEKLPVKCWVK